jgi:outer membrane protein TolC
LKYLNISKEQFFAKYTLLEELQSGIELITLDEALQTALQNRADLKMLSSEKDGLLRQKKNVKLFLYPKVNFALYGAHDFKYDNGFKAALDFSFPIERSLYESKNAQYMQRLSNIEKQREKKLLDIKISLTNTINSLQTLKETLDYASKELELAKKLENAEKKRFELGGGTLFVLNQREMNTLNIEKKLLYYKLTYLLLQEQLQNSMGLLH